MHINKFLTTVIIELCSFKCLRWIAYRFLIL